jgi:Flp pilus assembly secretin CpaC
MIVRSQMIITQRIFPGGRIMKVRTITNFTRLVLLGLFLLLFSAAPSRSETRDGAEWVPVSINAGETYVIENIKLGTKPAFRIAENPNAFLSYETAPGKLTMLGAEAGRWVVTVTNTSDRTVSYDLNAFAVAKPGAPLSPGNTPPSVSEGGLKSRPGAGSQPSSAADLPELATISSLRSARTHDAADAPSYDDASWNVPVPPGAAKPYEPSQSASQAIGHLESRSGQYRNDPSVLDSGDYSTESISGGKHYLPDDALSMMTGSSEVIDFRRRMTRISVADSKIADVQIINPFQLNLVAHQPGSTTLAIWDDQGRYEERTVHIDASGKQQVMLNTIIAELDRSTLENQGINLSVAFSKMGLSLVGLPGTVATPYSGSTSLQGGTGGVSGTLPTAGSIIPLLLSSNMTYGLVAQNADVIWQSFFQFLEQHSLGKILAEPHLLANSGEKAKFLSGGEIPIVIAQALNSSIVFKTFGTSVEFIPTVIGRSDIELLVKPEVSEPDYAHGVNLFGFTVPAFVTRRAETLVRLKDRQTLIIAGLILHEKTSEVQKVPYLGDIPWVRGLFRTTYWTDKETDLVMSVTPEIVRPLPNGGQVFLPSNRGNMTYDEIKTKALDPPDASRPRFDSTDVDRLRDARSHLPF